MKAARLHGVRDVRIHDEARPAPAAGEALVRVEAIGLCGSDLHLFEEGGIGGTRPERPIVPGHEMAGRTTTGYLFGGLASSRGEVVQFAVGGNGNIKGHGRAGGVFRGGMSGVAFGEGVSLVSRVTQGCQPVGAQREITAANGNVVLELGGEPALDVLLSELAISLEEPQAAMATLRATLVGLTDAGSDLVGRTGNFGSDVVVRIATTHPHLKELTFRVRYAVVE